MSAGETIFPASAQVQPKAPAKPRHSESGIIVEGLDNCLVKFAKCCTPVPWRPGGGLHHPGLRRVRPPRRLSQRRRRKTQAGGGRAAGSRCPGWTATWPYYQTSLEISAKDRDGLALDVAMALSTAEGEGQQPLRPQPCPTATPRSTMVLEVKDQKRAGQRHQQAQPGPGGVPRQAGGGLTISRKQG